MGMKWLAQDTRRKKDMENLQREIGEIYEGDCRDV